MQSEVFNRLQASTLAGVGSAYLKLGRRVTYLRADLAGWINANRVGVAEVPS